MKEKTKRILGVAVKWRQRANSLLCSNGSRRALIRNLACRAELALSAETDLFNIQCIVCLLSQWIKAYNCLVPRRLSLSKEGGKETPFPWSLAVHHQSLARPHHWKNKAAEEEAGLTMYPWLASQFNFTFLTKIKVKENFLKSLFPVTSLKAVSFGSRLTSSFLVRPRHLA